MFNTFPSNAVPASADRTGGGAYPAAPSGDLTYPASTVNASITNSHATMSPPTAEAGGFISLPTSSTGTYRLTDDGNNIVWTITLANITTAITGTASKWIGFTLGTDDLSWVAVIDTATAPDTIYICSVDAVGAITALANGAQFTVQATNPEWGADPDTNQGSNLYRASDGSGNFFVRMGIGQEMEINETTGALVTDPSGVWNAPSVPHKTANGTYIGGFNSDGAGDNSTEIAVTHTQFDGLVNLASDSGAPTSTELGGIIPMQWQGRVVMGSFKSAARVVNPKAFVLKEFDDWADQLAVNVGVKK